MAKTRKYAVLSPIKHDGTDYAEGEFIELTDEEASPLLGWKAIEKPSKAVRDDKDGSGDGSAGGPGGGAPQT